MRSYVLRQGRMTDGQKRAFEELWPRYGLPESEGTLDLPAIFGRDAPCHLEIGFGMGDALFEMARQHPENDYLGIEVHLPGVGRLLKRLAEAEVNNVRVLRSDAARVVESRLLPARLDAVYIFFPDPWPKKRHHKRRLIQPELVKSLARILKPGGLLHLATDWEEYAWHMLEVLEACPDFINLASPGKFSTHPPQRPLTKFEQRGQRLGHAIFDVCYGRRVT